MKLTMKNVAAQIKERFDIDCEMIKGHGYFYFASIGQPTLLDYAETTSVYVNYLGSYTLDEWVTRFGDLIEDVDLPDPDNSPIGADGVMRLKGVSYES